MEIKFHPDVFFLVQTLHDCFSPVFAEDGGAFYVWMKVEGAGIAVFGNKVGLIVRLEIIERLRVAHKNLAGKPRGIVGH